MARIGSCAAKAARAYACLPDRVNAEQTVVEGVDEVKRV